MRLGIGCGCYCARYGDTSWIKFVVRYILITWVFNILRSKGTLIWGILLDLVTEVKWNMYFVSSKQCKSARELLMPEGGVYG